MLRKHRQSISDTESSNNDETTKLFMDAHVEPSRSSDIGGNNPGKRRRLAKPVGGYGVGLIVFFMQQIKQ